MATIRIEERGLNDTNTVVSVDGSGDYPAKVVNPFSPEDEARLEWYFEQHLRFPFTDIARAQEAAESIQAYGESLFGQLFANPNAFAAYRSASRKGFDQLCVEIIGSSEFHRLHWEALKDPGMPKPLSVYAPMVRRSRTPQTFPAEIAPSSTINLLVVTARPHVERDVGYRTVSRPLVEALRAARVPVDIDFVRPGTYRALSEQLHRKGAGYYHVVHFDLHGALLSYKDFETGSVAEQHVFRARYGRPEMTQYEGERAFLFFEAEGTHGEDTERRADPAEASEVAERLLLQYNVPIVILNACQSGKQTGEAETSLAARLMQAGVQTVLGMAYSVTVSAAKTMMPKLYGALADGVPLDRAILAARGELEADKTRRAYYNTEIKLEDWLLPVVYQHKPTTLTLKDFTPDERAAWLREKEAHYRPRQPTYGFFGRDLDILRIEKRLLGAGGRSILLVRGMGGAGKSTLLHHLGAWWQQTGLVDRVFYFGWDEKAWSRQQLLLTVAGALYDAGRFHSSFLPLGETLQQADLAETLRANRHVLIFDNLESITGSPLSVPNTLTLEEQGRLREFIARLSGGRTLVLLGSRGGEDWMADATFGPNVHTLHGLDPEAASDLADCVLARHGATKQRSAPKFLDLMKLLAGYPLAIEVLLANLKAHAPAEVLASLEAGATGLDAEGVDKTESILRCIEYSHGNLSSEARGLLACLAPFTGVIFEPMLDGYTEQLRAQPVLAQLPFARWPAVLKEATDWGLLAPDPDVPGFLRLQPVLPYFLRQHLSEPARMAEQAAIETAFQKHYDDVAQAICKLLRSQEPRERQKGLFFVDREYTNVATALRLALRQQVPILNTYAALSSYLDAKRDERRGLELAQTAIEGLNAWPEDKLAGKLGFGLLGVIDDAAARYLSLRKYPEAEAAYRRVLQMLDQITDAAPELLYGSRASVYHQLGVAAQKQRKWTEAEGYYKQALALKVEFSDRYGQASTYHQLGRVAEEQRKWTEAEGYYKQALALKVEFSDRYGQASTYHQLGIVAQEQRKWTEAEGYYKQALALKVEFSDRYEQASTYHQLGIVALEQRKWTEAEGYYKQALAIYVEFNDRYAQAGTYHQLGMVAQMQQQWAEAEGYYKQALAINVEFNDRYAQAGTYHQLGMVAEKQRQWSEAEGFYRISLDIFHKAEDWHNGGMSMRSIARLWRASRATTVPAMVAEVIGVSQTEATELLEKLLDDDGDSKPQDSPAL